MRPTKLTAEQVDEIRILIGKKINDTQIGRKFNVNHSTIKAIRIGKTWNGVAQTVPKKRLVPCQNCGEKVLRHYYRGNATCDKDSCRRRYRQQLLENGRRLRVLASLFQFDIANFDQFLENVRKGRSVTGCRDCSCISPKQREACDCVCHGANE